MIDEAFTWRPSLQLQPLVTRYVGYRTEGLAPAQHRGLPSRHLTFIVALGSPTEIVAMPDPAFRPTAFEGFVAGLHAGPATIAHDGNQFGIQLALTPRGARTLFAFPAAELCSSVTHLDALIGRRAERLRDQLATAGTWQERFARLDRALVQLVAEGAGVTAAAPELDHAWQRLVDANGNLQIGALATDIGWSRRHLAERFRGEFGLTPKTAARVMRFERANRLLRRTDRPGLATVAATCGYFDQAHLTRDWQQLAGCSPTRWLAEELPFVQDEELVQRAS